MTEDRPKRKKSWRELDAKKDRSSHRPSDDRRDSTERVRERATKSTAYRSYKSNLDKMFSPGGAGADLPDSLRAKLGPLNEESRQKKELTHALRENPGVDTLRTFLEAGLELPPDARILMSLLDIREEALILKVLRRLLDLIEEEGAKPNRRLLTLRLDSIKLHLDDPEVHELADQVRAVLG